VLQECGSFIIPAANNFLPLQQNVKIYSAHYDLRKYHDALFLNFGIVFPAALENTVIKRKGEYLAGRFCAHRALCLLGYEHCQVTTSPERAPLWPSGVLGSISHTDDFAIGIVGSQDELRFVGVDAEKIQPSVFLDLAEQFSSVVERNYLNSLSLPYDISLLITFSAKECLFKALWPVVRCFFDFSCAEIINIDSARGEFTLRLMQDLTNEIKTGMIFIGKYYYYDESIVTFIANQAS
jgi:4'-phosphopantetheinyl transferase EntD